MPRSPSRLPATLGDVFSVASAKAAGVTDSRLRAPDLWAPYPGVCVRVSAVTALAADDDRSAVARDATYRRDHLLLRARAYAERMPPGTLFGHVTAAVIWGMPLPLRALRGEWDPVTATHGSRDLDVVAGYPHRAPRTSGTVASQSRSPLLDPRERSAIAVVGPAFAWASLATVLSLEESIAAADALVHIPRTSDGQHRDPDAAKAGLAALHAVAQTGDLAARRAMAEALPHVRVGSASSPETALRLGILRAGLPEPTLDYEVRQPDGSLVGVTEFAFERWRVLVEYEGDHHRTDRAQWHRDIQKHRECAALGWTVLRIAARDTQPTTDAAIGLIAGALRRAGWAGEGGGMPS